MARKAKSNPMEQAIAMEGSNIDDTTAMGYGDEPAVEQVTPVAEIPVVETVAQSEQTDAGYDIDSYEAAPSDLFSDEEERAMQSGWTPKIAFRGDPDKWRDAKAWNDRNNVRSVIEEQKQEIAELRRAQQEFINLFKEDKARTAQSQISSLEKEKEEAIRLADVDRVKKLDESINSLRGFASTAIIPNVPRETVPQKAEIKEAPIYVQEFVERNPWIKPDVTDDLSIRKRAYALSLEAELNRNRTSMPEAERYKYIENEVSQIFDGKQKNVAPVETRRSSMSTTVNPNGLPDYNSLSRETKQMIEHYTKKAEFAAKSKGKKFSASEYRIRYVKDLINNGVIDRSGKENPITRR